MDSPRPSAIVLAGGKSTRLGRDKASELLLGVPLLQRALDAVNGLCAEVVVVKARGQRIPELRATLELRIVEDLFPEVGPLGGLYTGLSAIRHASAIAIACDMPLVRTKLLAELIRLGPGYDAVVPISDGLLQPLCALYSTACLHPIRRRIEAGEYRLTAFLEDVRVLEVAPAGWRRFDPDGLSFLNVNRDEDLLRAESILQAESIP